jgi:hypothetical protein
MLRFLVGKISRPGFDKISATLAPAAICAAFVGLCYNGDAWAEDDKGEPPRGNLTVMNAIDSKSFWLAVIVMFAGFLFFLGQLMLLRRNPATTSDDIVKNCTITIVIIFASVLIIAGYNSQQAAQAFGLFGTIVGYLLGKSAGRAEQRDA